MFRSVRGAEAHVLVGCGLQWERLSGGGISFGVACGGPVASSCAGENCETDDEQRSRRQRPLDSKEGRGRVGGVLLVFVCHAPNLNAPGIELVGGSVSSRYRRACQQWTDTEQCDRWVSVFSVR